MEHIFYTGLLTNACVLLTLAAGYDLGFQGHLVSDATATISGAIQDATEQLVYSFMADVITTADAVRIVSETPVD